MPDKNAARPERLQRATVRFYAEMNDLLPPAQRQCDLEYRFLVSGSVKDAIESFGVPHTEVDLILVNGRSVSFDYLLRDGDRVSVYPVFESLDIGSLVRLRPEPLREPRFVLDAHLGKLAAYLRMLGLDALYRNDYDDDTLAEIAARGRILLTRDRGLLKRRAVERGYLLRSTDPLDQAIEVVRRFDLADRLAPFSRCLRCNTPLVPVAKEQVAHRLAPATRHYYDEFALCPACDRVHWKGSHYRRMKQMIERVRARAATGAPG